MRLEEQRIYRFGDFTLEVGEHRLLRSGEEVYLRPKSFETLSYLIKRHGHLVKKDELLETLWPDVSVMEATLTQCIRDVRKALQDDAQCPQYLKTIQRVGYKFTAEVEELPTAAEKEQATEAKSSLAIAVLPFVNLSDDPENEYFCDGLAEELINALTKVKDLRVVAHSSAFWFKGRDVDVREIGQKLNVGTVLEGSVRKAGDRLRISAQLINAADGYHLWSEQYDRQMEDVFAIEDEISLAIVDKLKIKLLSDEKAALMKRYTDNLEAYQLYLRGRYFWSRRYEGGLLKGLEHFQHAVEKDPRYALAYAGVADSYSSLGVWCFMPPRDVFPRAKAAAEKALEIDDLLAEAYTSLAMISIFYDWDWAAAENRCKRAIELKPGSVLSHHFYAQYLCMIGRTDEGVAEMNQALSLDPLSLLTNTGAGWLLHLAGKSQQAVEQLRQTTELDPNFGLAHYFLGLAYAQEARYEEALAAFEKAIEVTGGLPWAAEQIGYVYAILGERDKAEKVLQETLMLRKQKYVPSSGLAMIYFGLGEREKAFEWLEQAYEERDAALSWSKVLPELDSARSDPRFQELLHRLKLR